MAHACLAHCVISAIETRTGARFGGACKATPAKVVQGFKNSGKADTLTGTTAKSF